MLEIVLRNNNKEMLEKQGRRAITINNKQDENIKIHYKRDTYIMYFSQDRLHPHINW